MAVRENKLRGVVGKCGWHRVSGESLRLSLGNLAVYRPVESTPSPVLLPFPWWGLMFFGGTAVVWGL